MNTFKKLMSASVGAAALSASVAFAPLANAQELEVSASASVASMYLWRGLDLSDGSPAVSGDLVVSAAGFYGGIWGSSGDDSLGQEYDLFVGWGGEFGDFTVDISAWNYNYPDETLAGEAINFGDLTEVILSVGFGPVSFAYYDNVAGGSGYEYYTLGADVSKFSFKVGYHDFEEEDSDMTHVDISYAYNDNLSFTISQVVDQEDSDDATYDNELNFVVSYSLPIDL